MKHLLIILSILLSAISARAAVGVRLGSAAGTAGDTVSVSLYVDTELTAADNVYSYQFQVGFNANYLEAVEVNTDGSFVSGLSFPAVGAYSDYVSIAGASGSRITGSGLLLNMKFRLKAAGNAALTFRNGATANFLNEGSPALQFTNGSISIAAQAVVTVNIPGNSTPLLVGESLQCSASGGAAPYTWSVSNANAAITGTGLLTAVNGGSVEAIATDANGVEGRRTIALNQFKVQIRDTSFYQNNFVEIPVLFSNLDNTPVVSGSFAITYNESVLQLESVIFSGGLLAANNNSIQHNIVSGKVTVSFANTSGFTDSGTIFTLKFKVANIGSGGSYIDFAASEINEDLHPKNFRGYFSVRPFANLTVTPSAAFELFAGQTQQLGVSGGTAPYAWTSLTENLVSVSAEGNVTALKGGAATVQVRDVYGANKNIAVTVYDTELQPADTAASIIDRVFRLPIQVLRPISAARNFIAVQGKISCNSPAIDSIKIVTGNSLTQNWASASKYENASCIFAASGSNAVTGAGNLLFAEIHFNGDLAVGQNFNFTLSDIILNEGSPIAKIYGGTLSVSELINVQVKPVTGVALDTASLDLKADSTCRLTATVFPEDADDKTVYWTSSNSSVAGVSADGLVTARSAGTAIITVRTQDGDFTATCLVSVTNNPVAVTGVTLNHSTLALIVNSGAQLAATVLPANADNKNVTWASSNPGIVTVSSEGLLTAIAAGTANVTVTTVDGGFTATCAVTVSNLPVVAVQAVTLNHSTVNLYRESTVQLIETVQPTNAANKNVSWASSDETVARVSAEGFVIAVGVGTASIVVTTEDGGYTASCVINVCEKMETTDTPSANSVTITWKKIDGATVYTIIVYLDAEHTQIFGTYQITVPNMAYRQSADEMSYTVSGLSPLTTYFYNIEAKGASDEILAGYNGRFITQDFTGIDKIADYKLKITVVGDELHVEIPSAEKPERLNIAIFDVSGKCIRSQISQYPIYIGNLPSGLYIVKAGNKSAKFVKK